ncbi:hypothetical protein J4477_04920 [Candidatus Pacearchaeota archaeon]|nr:hypothetical protein [Candidatus Pacearchaeota archaeon]
MQEKRFGFSIDQKRLEEVIQVVCESRKNSKGIFSRDALNFLPQWNLPEELEYNPRQTSPKMPFEASLYLWTCSFFERLSQSREIIKNARRVWDSDKNWIFYPEKAFEKDLFCIEDVLREEFRFNLQGLNEEAPAQRYFYNSGLLLKKYGGDPRNIVNGLSVDESRKGLMEFKGIGSGIANLYIIYLMERRISSVIDPENILLKVDVHKGRIPLNTNAVIPLNGEVHQSDLAVSLEGEYGKAIKSRGQDPITADSSLWIIGSEVCSTQDYSKCRTYCPLVDKYCISNVGLDRESGRYIVSKSGKRVETRKNIGQEDFDFEV